MLNNKLGKLVYLLAIIVNLKKEINGMNSKNNLTIKKQYSSMNKLTDCSAKFDDGSILDLSSLDNPSKPLSGSDSVFTYYYNPCTPITCLIGKKTAAICKRDTEDDSAVENMGDQTTSNFNFDKINLLITYTSNTKTSYVQCVCSETDSNSFEFVRCAGSCYFRLTSKCCCPNGCKSKKSGLSFGSILLIIFFSTLTAYFLFGFVFLKFVKKNNGLDVIPNHKFWISLPGDVKGGYTFVIGKLKGNSGGAYQNI